MTRARATSCRHLKAGRAAANTQALSVDTVGGAQTFRVPLSPTGLAPATHYWCDWALQPSEHTALALGAGRVQDHRRDKDKERRRHQPAEEKRAEEPATHSRGE